MVFCPFEFWEHSLAHATNSQCFRKLAALMEHMVWAERYDKHA
jgi:hypothetical protein